MTSGWLDVAAADGASLSRRRDAPFNQLRQIPNTEGSRSTLVRKSFAGKSDPSKIWQCASIVSSELLSTALACGLGATQQAALNGAILPMHDSNSEEASATPAALTSARREVSQD